MTVDRDKFVVMNQKKKKKKGVEYGYGLTTVIGLHLKCK